MTYDLPSIKSKWQMLEGWEATSIVNLQGGEPYTLGDFSDDISLTGELNDRWNMSGPASNIHWSPKTTIPYIDPSQFITTTDGSGIQHTASGANPQAQLCVNQAFATGGQVAADQLIGNPEFSSIYGFTSTDGGCYVVGNTVITPPVPGGQGNMGRNIFRGPAFANWDFSLSKIWKLNERVKVQIRG